MAADGGQAHRQPTLLYAVKQVELAVRSGLDELLKPSGITATQYTALTVLERRTGLSTAELARNSFVTDQTMADMVTALLRRDLIERDRDPVNRRRLVISLTDQGRQVLDRHRAEVAELETRMLSGLTRRQAEDLRRYLDRCRLALVGEAPH